jgi:hypothetical protein
MSRQLCKERVWDNGDMTDCGLSVRLAGKCERHLAEEVQQMEKKLAELRAETSKLQTRLVFLLGEMTQ